jgi:hypothetical protein
MSDIGFDTGDWVSAPRAQLEGRQLEWREAKNDFGRPMWESDEGWQIMEYDGRFHLSTPGADYRFRQSYGYRETLTAAKSLASRLSAILDSVAPSR